MLRKLIAGNWKMHGLRDEGVALAEGLAQRTADGQAACDWLICPPFTLLAPVGGAVRDSVVMIGGQNCHVAAAGPHTGDISAAMLQDMGCGYVILGHSERRQDHGESNALVKAKVQAALGAGLIPIVCVGESESQRDAGKTLAVIEEQFDESLPGAAQSIVIAYEPVWAIGTGRTPAKEDVAEVHKHLRGLLRARLGGAGDQVRLLYGGSVKPGNAAELLAIDEVDGALVGGASLKLDDFWAIGEACP